MDGNLRPKLNPTMNHLGLIESYNESELNPGFNLHWILEDELNRWIKVRFLVFLIAISQRAETFFVA